jgi:RNA polymerase sigma-70 factor (ECF subfamily)
MSTIGIEQLADLVRTQGGPLRLYALQFLSGLETSTADDVVQEAFIKLARQSPPPAEAKAWLYQVVRRAALSMRRGTVRRRKHEADAAAEREAWFQPVDGVRLEGAEATAALEQLDETLRETVVAHLWGGLTFEEIATLTGTSSSTAHRRYEQGLRELREHWNEPCRNLNQIRRN